MKINRKLAEAKWVDYEDDIKFKIKSFPMSHGIFFQGSKEDLVEFTWKRFNYCVVDWSGFVDEKDEPLECNEDNKKYIFDYYPNIMMWVSSQIVEHSAVEEYKKKT